MASGTLDRETEKVIDGAEKITQAAAAEQAERVQSSENMPGTSRAWDSKAQID
jgi:hypothetical protein